MLETIFLIIILGVIIFHIGFSIRFWIYYWFFKNYYIPKHSYSAENIIPTISIFVPCKGTSSDLYDNLKNLVTQKYPKEYEVIFITESNEDPAVEVIKKLTSEFPKNTKHVIAGKAKKCGQKNYNLLKGIEQAKKNDLYVFSDADIRHPQGWLVNLIDPLVNKKIGATCGFQWIDIKKISAKNIAYSQLVAYQNLSMTDYFRGFLWGGAMAVRRELFEELKVADRWAITFVDDMILTAILRKNKYRIIHVPLCISVNYEKGMALKDIIDWYARQLMMLKYDIKAWWLMGITMHIAMSLIFLAIPVIGILSIFYPTLLKFFFLMLCGLITQSLGILLLKFRFRGYHKKISSLRWLFIAPLSELIGSTACAKTIFMKKVKWKNIEYVFNKDGTIKEVIFNDT